MDFDIAIQDFLFDMKTKFHAKDAKHGEQGITRLTDKNAASMTGLFDHFISEFTELCEAPLDRTEMVDVANMCFAMWWQQRSREQREGE